MSDTDQIIEEAGLIYLSDSSHGYSRKKITTGFAFFDKKNSKVTDSKILDRIKKLAIPPAWADVWISPKSTSHLQATGIDQAGRKQYRYHHEWSKSRNENKYIELLS